MSEGLSDPELEKIGISQSSNGRGEA